MRLLCLLCALAAAGLLVSPAAAGPAGSRCAPTPEDAFGPFGRGMPPLRTKIGTGHVLTGVVLSALDCRPIRGAFVQLWQANRNGRYTRQTSATVVSDRAGRFRFEGPPPTGYEGRPPHIHIRVAARGHRTLHARFVVARGSRSCRIRLVLQPTEL